MQQTSSNVVWQQGDIGRRDREKLLGQKGTLLWFTGLSGSGKSTIANAVEKKLHESGRLTVILDGDNIRHGINGDLGFSTEDRKENIRRIGEVSRLFVDTGVITLACFISPFGEDREKVRSRMPEDFIEVYVDCPLRVCEGRDPKSLYRKARFGQIKEFTGISSPYEAPENPEITLQTDKQSLEECVDTVLEVLAQRGIIGK